jgi:hypothetical protein
MPEIVIEALANDLKPVIDAQRRLTARWSCWWVGTSLEVVALCGASLYSDSFEPVPSPTGRNLLYSSPRSEPIVQISRNGLPRALLPIMRSQTVG